MPMSHITKTLEFSKHLETLYQRAILYEWISLLYMISAAIFSFSVMSDSQTMKTVWLEDTLGIVPPLSFLIACRIVKWPASKNFPYGFHRIINLAYLSSSLALLLLGLYLFFDGLFVLVQFEHPTIPTVEIFGHFVWLGNLMIVALIWSSVPSTILGHIKIPLAEKLYDKILYADSKMNKASWMSGFASIFGVIGIGFGYWWADATVGMIISINIINDGYTNIKNALLDLLDEIPKTLTGDKQNPIVGQVKKMLNQESWIASAEVRFRDEGHVFFGDVFIKPKKDTIHPQSIVELREKIKQINWRLHDIVITPTLNVHKHQDE